MLYPAIGDHHVASDSIGIIKSIPVLVSQRQIKNTFNDNFHNDINSIKLFLPKSEFKKK